MFAFSSVVVRVVGSCRRFVGRPPGDSDDAATGTRLSEMTLMR
jgi:hypothetical protein